MLLHYLGELKIRNFVLFVRVKHVANVTLLFIIYPTDICQMSWKYVQWLTLCKYQLTFYLLFVHVLSKLKALHLSKAGLSTIKYQHSKNLIPWANTTWTKTRENANCLHEFVHKSCSKCLPFVRTHVWRRFLHWSIAVSIMSPGMYPWKWYYVSQGNAATYLRCGSKLIWILLEIYLSLQQWKNFANRSRIDKVIAIVRVVHFFDSRCTLYSCMAPCRDHTEN